MEHFQTIQVRLEEPILFVRFHRPEAKNTINDLLIQECHRALDRIDEKITVLVLEGSPEYFCFGADFDGMRDASLGTGQGKTSNPEPLYLLWQRLATGPFVSIAHVRGQANAGGIGFVAASDIVIAEEKARFSLSELLFGLLPACVLPFLIRRIGHQKAGYMTLMTQPVSAGQASDWGLVDAFDTDSESLLRKHLLRLRRLSKSSVTRYKNYQAGLGNFLQESKNTAVAANLETFSDRKNLEGIIRYVETGRFPWES